MAFPMRPSSDRALSPVVPGSTTVLLSYPSLRCLATGYEVYLPVRCGPQRGELQKSAKLLAAK